MAERVRTLHYRKAVTVSGDDYDLQSALQRAHQQKPDVAHREEPRGSATCRVIAGAGVSTGMFRGRLMQFTSGQRQHFLERDNANQDYRIDTTPVPRGQSNLRREFVESLLYFAVSRHHVMFIGSAELGSKALEEHFRWLLRDTAVIQAGEHVLLSNLPSLSSGESLSNQHVNKVVLGSDLGFEVVESVPAQRKTSRRERVEGYKEVQPTGELATALTSILGDWFGDVPLRQALKRDERIGVKLELTYSNRKKTSEGFELMRKLAVAGRHFDHEDCQVTLANGLVLKGDDLRVKKPLSVAVSDETGIVDEFSLWTRLSSWLETAIRDRIVY